MKNKYLYLILLVIIFALSIAVTYAYFSLEENVVGEPSDMTVDVGRLRLRYTDGPEIKAERIEPGWYTTKTVEVENIGDFDAYYSLDWLKLTNQIERNELVISISCVSKLNNETSGTCLGLDTTPVASSRGNIIKNRHIETGYKHILTIRIEFIETGSAQNYNQNKAFNGVINANESEELMTLKGVLRSANNGAIANARVETHSEVVSDVTDENGYYELIGVSIGNHTLKVFDSTETQILEEPIVINKTNNTSIVQNNNILIKPEETEVKRLLTVVDVVNTTLNSLTYVNPPTITLNVNGGNNLDNNSISLTSWVYGELPTPTTSVADKDFDGWYTSSVGGTKITSTSNVTNTDNHTLYARWIDRVPLIDLCNQNNVNNAADCISTYSTNDPQILKINRDSTGNQNYSGYEYRYSGSNPDNYVTFNNQTWRIVGVFKTKTSLTDDNPQYRLKLVASPLGDFIFNWNSATNTVGTANNWAAPEASLKNILNNGYLNASSGASGCYNSSWLATDCGFNTGNGINSTARAKIADNVWYLGNVGLENPLTTLINNERGSSVYSGNSSTWVGKVGLLYPSDYGYGSKTCYQTTLPKEYNTAECSSSNWLYSGVSEWLISPSDGGNTNAMEITNNGNITANSVVYQMLKARPTVYLNTDVVISSGRGTSASPYVLN